MRFDRARSVTLALLIVASRARAQAGDAALRARFCPDSAERQGFGALVGRVRNAENDTPLSGVNVVLRWDDVGVNKATGQATLTPRILTSVTDDQARYRFCVVPRYTPLVLQAQAADRNTGAIALQLGDEPIFVRGLLLDLATAASSTGAIATGSASVIGEVVTATGQPVRNAQVQLDGAVSQATTNDTGVFVLSRLPAGTGTLVARGIGFLPKRVTVDLRAGASSAVTVVLDKTIQTLDSIRVIAKRYNRTAAFDAEFESRRRASPGGTFLTEEELSRRVYADTWDIFRNMRGLSVSSDGVVSITRGSGSMTDSRCIPSFVLDGVQMQTTLDIVRPNEIKAIEVYRGAETPVQYNDTCGVIVVWTK